MLRRSFVVALLWACNTNSPAATTVASATPNTIIDASPPTTSASTAAPRVDPKEAAMRQVAIDWNDALNARDYTKLQSLHAPLVTFYGRTIDAATYLTNIKQALAKDPSFHQDITNLAIATMPTKTTLSFHKKDAKHEVDGFLVIHEVDGRWLIDVESDQATVDLTKCVRPDTAVVVTGEVKMISTNSGRKYFKLDMPICIVGANERNSDMAARIDAIDEVFLQSDKDWLGQHIRVHGTVAIDYFYLGTIAIVAKTITPL